MKTLGRLGIFETTEEIVDPQHTALVLWDCQNALVNNIFNREEFLATLEALLLNARRRKIPIVYTKITALPLEYQSAWSIYQSMKRFGVDDPSEIPVFVKPGSPESEVHSVIAPEKRDIVLEKSSPSIFFGTNFEYMMRFHGIQTIVFTGIATEYGVEHSAREAGVRGFYPVVISDGCSSRDKAAHEMALKIMSRLCVVLPSKEILREWVA